MPACAYAVNESKDITGMLLMHTKELDLNLLRILAALLDLRGVSRAAEELGISQPAASRALGRLRKVLGDPLLVRSQGFYRLTPRAEELKPEVALALRAVGQVFAPAAFDPAITERRFTVATTDYGAVSVLQRASPCLLRSAPRARLDVVQWNAQTLAALADGHVDLALYADDPLPPSYSYRRLFSETFTCLYRMGHPIGKRAVTGSKAARLKALGSFPQAVIAYPSGRVVQYDDVLAKLGVPTQRVALSVPYFMAAPWIIAESDLVLTAPTRIATQLASLANLATAPFPATDAGFEYRMVWHERMHRDLGHRWLRELVLASVQR